MMICFVVLALSLCCLGSSGAPADTSNQNLAVARLYSYGTHNNGDGPELAHCMISPPNYDSFHDDLSKSYATVGITLFSYTEYPQTKDMVLAPNTDEHYAENTFVDTCKSHKGAPLRFH